MIRPTFLGRIATLGITALAMLLLCSPVAARGQRTSVQNKTEQDLRLITFKSEHGQLLLILPAEIGAGDTVSGTVLLVPRGKSDQEREKNQQAWKGYRIELASQAPLREDIDSRRVVWSLAASPASRGNAVGKGDISVVLRDGAGQEMAQTSVPLLRFADASLPRERERVFILPQSGKQGEPLSLRGNFDGDAATTHVFLGGEAALVLAESPRVSVVQTPKQALGKTRLTLQEGNSSARHQGDFDHQKRRQNTMQQAFLGVLLGLFTGALLLAYALNKIMNGG